jgi:predicted acetyltransferase
MIRFATKTSEPEIRKMWKICFNDPDEFIDIYFAEKYQNSNTLIYFDKNRPVASLQMLPYRFTFCGVEIDISYISGACTLPNFRNKGYMKNLMIESLKVINDKNIPLCLLIPADNWLRSYYQRYGFETVFAEGEKSIFLNDILNEAKSEFENAYFRFNSIFRNKDFCIQKSKDNFKTIVKNAALDNVPPKINLPGMARLINTELLLKLFAAKYPDKSFILEMNDSMLINNNAVYKIEKGVCSRIKGTSHCKLNENTLCRLLFGYRLEQLMNSEITEHFEQRKAMLNLMLE